MTISKKQKKEILNFIEINKIDDLSDFISKLKLMPTKEKWKPRKLSDFEKKLKEIFEKYEISSLEQRRINDLWKYEAAIPNYIVEMLDIAVDCFDWELRLLIKEYNMPKDERFEIWNLWQKEKIAL